MADLGVHSLADLAGGVSIGLVGLMVGGIWSEAYSCTKDYLGSLTAILTAFMLGALCCTYPDPRAELTSYRDVIGIVNLLGGLLLGAELEKHCGLETGVAVGVMCVVLAVFCGTHKPMTNHKRCIWRGVEHCLLGVATVCIFGAGSQLVGRWSTVLVMHRPKN